MPNDPSAAAAFLPAAVAVCAGQIRDRGFAAGCADIPVFLRNPGIILVLRAILSR